MTKKQEPDLERVMREFTEAAAPMIEQLTALMKLPTWTPKFVDRLKKAIESKKGITLNADDAYRLGLLLKTMADGNKK